MRQSLLLLLLLVATNMNFAQTKTFVTSDSQFKGYTFGFGGGIFYSGYFDKESTQFVIDVSKKLDTKIALSASLDVNFAKNNKRYSLTQMVGRVSEQFLQTNFLFSPFRNDRRNDFKIGAGLGTMLSEIKYPSHTEIVDNVVVKEITKSVVKGNIVGNLALENDYKINDKLKIGVRASLLYKFINQPIHYYIKDSETQPLNWAAVESVFNSRIVPSVLFRVGYTF